MEEVLTYVGSEETIADTMLFKQASVFTFEATDESLIGRIERIAKLEGNYYVLDRQTNRVLVFDNEGRYLRTIGRIGGGEGEYVSLRDMAIDTYDQKIWLLVEPSALLCYRLDGSFEKKLPLKGFANALAVDKRYIYLNNSTYVDDQQQPYSLTLVDKKDGTQEDILPTVKEIAPYCYSRGSVFAPSRDHILYARRFDDNIYQLADGKIEATTPVEWNELRFPDSEKDKQWECSDLNKFCWNGKHVYSLTDMRENDSLMLFRTNLFGSFVLYKQKNQIVRYGSIEQSDLHIPLPNYQPVEGEDGEVFFVYPAHRLEELNAMLKKRGTLLPESYARLFSTLDSEANPLIFRYTLK